MRHDTLVNALKVGLREYGESESYEFIFEDFGRGMMAEAIAEVIEAAEMVENLPDEETYAIQHLVAEHVEDCDDETEGDGCQHTLTEKVEQAKAQIKGYKKFRKQFVNL